MKPKTRPPSNHGAGRERSLEVRRRRSALHDKLIWDLVVAIALWEEPNSLKSYAEELNMLGLRSANGTTWTAQKLSHIFKRHGTSAKALTRKLSGPDPFQKRPAVPKANLENFRRAIESIEAPSEANGSWVRATMAQPSKADIVRHPEFGEGQFVAEAGLGKLRCRFLDHEVETFDVVISAHEIEIFRYALSPCERQMHADALAEKWLRLSNE